MTGNFRRSSNPKTAQTTHPRTLPSQTKQEQTTAVDPQYNTSGSFSEEMEWSLQGIFGVGNFFG